ncbi:MAG: hypothetical protein KTR32_36460 [Granulosicoccus sp.]|nr:hypothetical protein [Granulosicoccus sp.]
MIKKWLSVFAVFSLIHLGGWIGADRYLSASPSQILVVVDTSYSMKPHFAVMDKWLKEKDADARYEKLIVGTDKATLGEFRNLKSSAVIFRTSFGRMSADALRKYERSAAQKKILLSDGSINPDGWDVIEFR